MATAQDMLSQFHQTYGTQPATTSSGGFDIGQSVKQALSSPTPKAQPKVGGIRGFAQRNLPAIASTGGAIIGGVLAPETGGLSLAIPALLAAAGGAAGEVAKEKTTGQKVSGSDIAAQGALGATGEIGGQIAGKVGGAILGKIAGGAAKAGKAATTAKDNTQAAQYFAGAAKPVLKNNDAVTTARTISGYGIAPENLRAAIKATTYGPDSVLKNATRRAYESAGPVDLSGLAPKVQDIASELNVKSPGSGQPLVDLHNTNMDRILGTTLISIKNGAKTTTSSIPDTALTKAPALGVFDYKRNLQGIANSPGTKPELKSALNSIAGHLDNHLVQAGADTNVANGKLFSPEELATLTAHSPKLAQEAQNQTTAGGVRSLMAPFAKSKNILDSVDKEAEAGATGKASGVLGPATTGASLALAPMTHGLSLGALAVKAAGSPQAKAVVGKSLGTLAGAGRTIGDIVKPITEGASKIAPALQSATGQIAAHQGAAALAPVAPDTSANTTPPDNISTDNSGTDPNAPVLGQGGTGDQSTTGMYTQANMMSDIQRDPKNSSTYLALYKELNPAPSASQTALTLNQKNEAAGAQKALSTLGDYANQLKSVGGGKGPVGGSIESLLGRMGLGSGNQAARALESQRVDVASSVAAALSPRGTAQASITKLIADSLPKITDPSGVADAKLKQLAQRIQDGYYTSLQSIKDNSPVTSPAPAISGP